MNSLERLENDDLRAAGPEALRSAPLGQDGAAPHADPSCVTPSAGHNASLRRFLRAAGKASPSWPRRRRIRALQELLIDVKDIVVHVIDELEVIRSGERLSTKVRR